MLPVALAIIQGVLSMSKKKEGQNAANLLGNISKLDSLVSDSTTEDDDKVVGTKKDLFSALNEDEEED